MALTPTKLLDHIGIFVHPSQYDETVAWYEAALAPLGTTKQIEIPGVSACGFGPEKNNAPFWIGVKEAAKENSGIHIAFSAKDHEAVDKFNEEGVKAGGKSNGEPGIRKMYHPNYYAAFVVDPAGNNVEVVDHKPQ